MIRSLIEIKFLERRYGKICVKLLKNWGGDGQNCVKLSKNWGGDGQNCVKLLKNWGGDGQNSVKMLKNLGRQCTLQNGSPTAARYFHVW